MLNFALIHRDYSRIAREIAGWVMCSAFAARRMLCSSTTARKALSWCGFIEVSGTQGDAFWFSRE